MNWLLGLSLFSATCAAIPALLFVRNLRLYQPAPENTLAQPWPRISVLVPARNEERGIADCLQSILASRQVELEVIVLDDHSTDATAAIVERMAQQDARARLVQGQPLPQGWSGKQHACHQLSQLAMNELLLFVDADVRLQPNGLARSVAQLQQSGADLLSGFPQQQTETLFERLLLPLMHFVLLGFLPISRMRASTHPAYAAGCGQFMLVTRAPYEAVGGHQSISQSLHDGIHLPASLRRGGYRTDLFDATDIACCRMYHCAAEVFAGLAKNAVDGCANPRLILPVTAILLAGQVLPPLLLLASLVSRQWWVALVAGLATLLAFTPRLLAARRFRQPWLGAVAHPLAIGLFLAIQWYALARYLAGRPASWKGRHYAPSALMTDDPRAMQRREAVLSSADQSA